jgi:hypothetical protein
VPKRRKTEVLEIMEISDQRRIRKSKQRDTERGRKIEKNEGRGDSTLQSTN